MVTMRTQAVDEGRRTGVDVSIAATRDADGIVDLETRRRSTVLTRCVSVLRNHRRRSSRGAYTQAPASNDKMATPRSRVVFVGNIPYEMSEVSMRSAPFLAPWHRRD